MTHKDWFVSKLVYAADSFRSLHCDSFTEWEMDYLRQAVEDGHLSWNDHLFKATGKKSPYNIFTLNREYFIQLAAYAHLIYEYKYPPQDCQIEYHSMDVVVFKNKQPFICVEAKKKDSEAVSLIAGIRKYSKEVISAPVNVRNDALRKANYLFKDKPSYFWLVTAEKQRPFSVTHHDHGFDLVEIENIPKYNQI